MIIVITFTGVSIIEISLKKLKMIVIINKNLFVNRYATFVL